MLQRTFMLSFVWELDPPMKDLEGSTTVAISPDQIR